MSRDIAELEREIAATRADLDEALDMLQAKMTPSALIDQAFGHAQRNPSVLTSGMSQMFVHKPFTALLMSAGVNWFLSKRAERRDRDAHVYDSTADRHRVRELAGRAKARVASTTDRARMKATNLAHHAQESASHLNEEAHHLRDAAGERLHDLADTTKERFTTLKDSGARRMHDLSDKAHDFSDKTRARSRKMKNKTRGVMHDQKDRAVGFFEKQPLLVGALLAVVGAALSSAIPATGAERRAAKPLAAPAKRLKQKAKTVVLENLERGASLATAAIDDATTKIEENLPGRVH